MSIGQGLSAGVLVLLAALALVSVCACLPVVPNAVGQAERLCVVTGGGGVVEIDSVTGRMLRAGIAAGDRPWQVAAGANGTILVLSLGAGAGRGELGVVGGGGTPEGSAAAGRYRRITLEPRTSVELLAGDGTGRAVAAYGPRPDGLVAAGRGTAACRLALVDATTGSVLARRDVCDERTERVLSLALETTGTASVAYAAVWRVNPEDASGRGTARLVTVPFAGTAGGESGIGLGAARPATAATVDGVPVHVLVAPGTGRTGETHSTPRLLTVEAGGDGGDAHHLYTAAEPLEEHAVSWRLVIRPLPQLDIEREIPLPYRPASVVVAPDGSRVYALAGHLQGVLMEADVLGGSAVRLHRLLEGAMGLAVTNEWIYVGSPGAGSVSQLDRMARVRRTIPLGKPPIWIGTGKG